MSKSFNDIYNDLLKQGHDKEYSYNKAYEYSKNNIYDQRVRLSKRVAEIVKSNHAYMYILTIKETYNTADQVPYIEKQVIKWCRKYFDYFVGSRQHDKKSGRPYWQVFAIYDIKKLPTFESWKFGNFDIEKLYDKNIKRIRNALLKISYTDQGALSYRIFHSKLLYKSNTKQLYHAFEQNVQHVQREVI